MSTSITVRRYLDKQDVRYATASYSGETQDVFKNGTKAINPNQIAKAIVLKDLRGLLMAVLPGPNHLNLETLNRQLHRNLQPAGPEDYHSIVADCSPGIVPPLGEAYGFETIVDDGLLNQDLIYFVSGNSNELVRVSGYDFQLLHSNAWYGNTFSDITAEESESKQTQPNGIAGNKANLKKQIQKINNLPPMPTMAQKIIQLNTDPYTHAEDLAKLIETDPSLSAQIIRYAQSPFYGYQGTVTSVRQAISRVLGYDLVMNIALGICVTRPFKTTPHGPLGLHSFWRHATYSATLAQGLCNIMPRKIRPLTGTAYLSGLLHNFGFLILGYLLPREFTALNNAISESPDTPIAELEERVLGGSHTELGRWLMETWNMPPEITVSVAQHHNEHYSGPHAEYSRLVYLADILLKSQDIGDASTEEVPETLLESMGLTSDQALAALEKTIQGSEELDTMARQLAA
ncbi:MAG: HDOD domain-containing protein [Gammaproteobacteria bacterium]|nr:HDOD domain-containing protein [Gammaproteobacteria bacterium]